MDQLREAQREKWLRAKQEKEGFPQVAPSSAAPTPAGGAVSANSAGNAGAASSSRSAASAPPATALAGPGASVPASSAASSAATPVAASAAASAAGTSSAGAARNARRVHILPVGQSPELSDQRRLELLTPALRAKRNAKELIKTGLFIDSQGHQFIVVKCEPDECVLAADTDYFVNGDPLLRLDKVQFICMWDFESSNVGQDTSVLFSEYISPYFRSICDSGEAMGSVVSVGETLPIFGLNFQVMAVDPSPPDMGIIDSNTMVYVDWDSTPEFTRIHIVPFQDTLPHAYEFDVFNDYLKPYLTRNKQMKYVVNDQFTYQGVQFKVVCCEPNGPARIGRNTTIYCEGVLHPSLRNLLPPELLEQLSTLPPGLQMLLLNTEALAGGYEDRLIEVQEMLSRRRGLSNDTIARLESFRWEGVRSADEQTQCMVCLSNFAVDEEVRRLPCRHLFHSACIDEWLRRCTDCPICKSNVDRAVRRY